MKFIYFKDMVMAVKMNRRGTVTLPRKIRSRYLMKDEGLLLVEATKDGILLKPAMISPIETYSRERLEEFEQNNQRAISKSFKPKRKKK